MNQPKKQLQLEKAVNFCNSIRGRYIIGQALHIAIEELNKVPAPHKEPSNIQDMEFLRDNLFNMYSTVQKISSKINNKREGK